MEHNREIKITIVALLAYFVFGMLIWQPLIGDKFWAYEPVRQTLAWVVAFAGITWAYYKGSREWYYTISLHLANYLIFVMFVDSINITMVYIEYFPNVLKANAVLNSGKTYLDLALCSGIYAVINFVFFCLVMPNVPDWLCKSK